MNQGEVYTSVDIVGTGFTVGATVSLGAGITLGSYNVISPTLITIDTLTCELTATLGTRDVTVTTPSGSDSLVGGVTVDYTLVAANFITSAAITGATQRTAVNGFVQRLKGFSTTNSSNVLPKIRKLFPYCPIDASTANATCYAKDLLGGSDGTFVNFVSGDFLVTGLAGGGTKYLNMNFNPVAQSSSPTNFGFGVDATTTTTAVTNPIGLSDGANTQYTSLVYFSGRLATGIAEAANTSRVTYANMPANLLFITVNGTTKTVYNNGSLIDSFVRTGSAFFNASFFAHARNTAGTPGTHDPRVFRGFLITDGLTANEARDLDDAWDWFQANVISGGR
jgi:hypothetical protein